MSLIGEIYFLDLSNIRKLPPSKHELIYLQVGGVVEHTQDTHMVLLHLWWCVYIIKFGPRSFNTIHWKLTDSNWSWNWNVRILWNGPSLSSACSLSLYTHCTLIVYNNVIIQRGHFLLICICANTTIITTTTSNKLLRSMCQSFNFHFKQTIYWLNQVQL